MLEQTIVALVVVILVVVVVLLIRVSAVSVKRRFGGAPRHRGGWPPG